MRALIAGAMTLLMMSGAVRADPLTCDRFKQKLNSAIHAGGDLVAPPYPYTPSKEDDTREDFGGIVGLYGSVSCNQGKFFAFGATAELNHADAGENSDRQVRLVALSSAAICAVEALPSKNCFALARSMHNHAIKDLTASVHRGDPSPGGVGQHDLNRSGADAQFDAADNNTVTFSLNVSPKDSVEDLKP